MKRKVAIIDPLGAHGSSHHFYLFGQITGLRDNNVDIRLYTNSETKNPNIKNVEFYQTFGDLYSSKIKMISGFRYVFGSIYSILHARINKVTIFHFHVFNANYLLLFNLLLLKLLFSKIVITAHDITSFSEQNNSSFISKLVYRMVDLILTHNKFSRNEITKKDTVLKDKIKIVPHGNYTPFINIQKDKFLSREFLDLPFEKTILLFFGMIKKVKGLEILLNSLREVVDKNADVILLIAGKPWQNDFHNYQKIIDENNLSNNVILHTKYIPDNEVEYYYAASDLVVLPYKKIYQSGVLMMALSYEKPVLLSDLPPLKEVITDNKNGFLFKSEDALDLANRLNEILANKNQLEKVRHNGSVLVNTKFSWNQIARLTKEFYQTL
tara:strand:- start:13717 stop:14862 length:1146 start_codon:yes stop_codon:yes gene_type:complete